MSHIATEVYSEQLQPLTKDEANINQQQSSVLTNNSLVQSTHLANDQETGNGEDASTKQVKITMQKQRLVCLDVLRGLTMMGMIMVDSMGNFNYVIWPLDESDWDGLSTADCVFPSFLFIMGLAIPLALKREQVHDKATWLHIFKRSALLFLIGMALNFQGRIPQIFTTSPFMGFRIMGVLQRLALCYLIVSACYLLLPAKPYYMLAFIITLQLIYTLCMYLCDVPSWTYKNENYLCGRAQLSSVQCNFEGYTDRKIFGLKYMLGKSDPEGLFSTLTALTNTTMGLFCTLIMRWSQQRGAKSSQSEQRAKLELMYLWGALGGFCILIGCLIALGNPVNKKLWSPSFAYITSGIAACGLALCYLLVDILKGPSSRVRTAILKPFLWLGMNPLFVFVAMIFFDNLLMNNIKWGTGSGKRSLWGYLDEVWLNSWLRNEYVSSTVFSLLNLILWMAMARLLYNRNIFIKL